MRCAENGTALSAEAHLSDSPNSLPLQRVRQAEHRSLRAVQRRIDLASTGRVRPQEPRSRRNYPFTQFPDQLQTDISNASESFSVGQKQLLCLARALIRRNRILVLDEATSNVDMETDAFIQRAIREKFADTTVITIAHRLNTIADYDFVVVMENGRVAEAGHPFELIKAKKQFF